MDPELYEIAHTAATRAIDDQARVLESLRSRAGTLFAATALVTSFLGGQALSRATQQGDDLAPLSFTGAAVVSFVLVALLTLATLLAHGLRFSVSASAMIGLVEERAASDPVTVAEAHRELALLHDAMYDRNARWVRVLLWFFRIAILFLVGEVTAWIIVLWRGRP